MTSKLTRERLQEIAEDGFLKHGESKELARMALAEKASEPVILYRERNPYNGLTTGWQELTENEFSFLKENAGENAEFLTLYRHAQPAPVVPVMPDFKKLARELVDNLVDCGGLDEGVKEKYLEWAEKTCRAVMLQAGNAPVNGVTAGKPLTITLPDTSSKAFWSGSGKTEVFHPDTYRRWVKESIERNCVIARIDVKVK
ncbi:hypothetical protein ACYBUV_20105 [Klebsiella pneumoniae]|uniref:hypothetical protein n=1 Tax=Klebsiella pneumoniae TaxID=573 RepID=UPI000808A7D5|nr:Uncharacterised protein [Klebsiella pneumoniae]